MTIIAAITIVIGYLTDDAVDGILDNFAALPEAEVNK